MPHAGRGDNDSAHNSARAALQLPLTSTELVEKQVAVERERTATLLLSSGRLLKRLAAELGVSANAPKLARRSAALRPDGEDPSASSARF
jgi:hypothetical protein